MPNTTLTDAIKEAYATAPSEVVIYDTLEFKHNSFAQPIRLVANHRDLIARLENNSQVTFTGHAFEITLSSIYGECIRTDQHKNR